MTLESWELKSILATLQSLSREDIEIVRGRGIGARTWEVFASDPIRGFMLAPPDVQASIATCLNISMETPETVKFPKLSLPRRERQILDELKRYDGRRSLEFLPFDRLYRAVYGDDSSVLPEIVQSHVSRLRKKLQPLGWTVKSSRFSGYRLERING
jgi:hypothetical protein